MARTEVLLVVTWAVLLICWEPLHHQLLEMLPLKHIWRICSNSEIVSYSATNLSVAEGFGTPCALQEYSQDLLSYFLLAWIDVRSWLRIIHPTNTLSCECHIIPVFRTNLNIFYEFSQDALLHFSSNCSKEIINKKINNSCHGFSCGEAACNGIQHSVICIICFYLITRL